MGGNANLILAKDVERASGAYSKVYLLWLDRGIGFFQVKFSTSRRG
jgi:hypothetical protein